MCGYLAESPSALCGPCSQALRAFRIGEHVQSGVYLGDALGDQRLEIVGKVVLGIEGQYFSDPVYQVRGLETGELQDVPASKLRRIWESGLRPTSPVLGA